MMQIKQMGIFAGLSGCALTGNAPASPQTVVAPVALRPIVPLGGKVEAWRAKRLLAEAQMDWQEAQKIIAPAPEVEIEAWEIAQILNEMRISPPLATLPVAVTITGIRRGEPHRASLDEVDYELFESLRGEL